MKSTLQREIIKSVITERVFLQIREEINPIHIIKMEPIFSPRNTSSPRTTSSYLIISSYLVTSSHLLGSTTMTHLIFQDRANKIMLI